MYIYFNILLLFYHALIILIEFSIIILFFLINNKFMIYIYIDLNLEVNT